MIFDGYMTTIRTKQYRRHSASMYKYISTLSFRLIAITVGIFILVIFLTPSSKMPYRTSIPEEKTRKTDSSDMRTPLFEEHTLLAGIVSQHVQGGAQLSGINETLGAGVCAFDYNNDGWIDILTIGGSGQTRYYGRTEWWQKDRGNTLYQNMGNGRFEAVTQESGLNIEAWGMGCATADFDNDGDQDVLLINLGKNLFFRNNGDNTFTEITTETGITGDLWSTSAAVADYDNDGLLDIYIVNYIDYSKGARTLEKNSGFRSRSTTTFNHNLYSSQPNRLYHNKGNLKFEDVTEKAGVANTSGRGLSAIWNDVNADNLPDLIVANDSGFPNSLYINNKNLTFVDASSRFNLNTSKSTRGIATGDIDNDGDMDIVMSTDNMTPIIAYIKNDSPNYPLFSTTKKRTFSDRSRELGLSNERQTSLNGWGLVLQDFNNDGWIDLFSANGHLTPDPDNPRIPQGQAKQLWLNQKKGTFADCIEACSKHLSDLMSARGIAVADYDNDGDLDVYLSHNNNMGQLLINKTDNHHWINLRLEGNPSNRDAIGTKVQIKTAQGTQTRMVDGNPSFLSGGDKRLHFGLNTTSTIDEINIQWPNGDTRSFSNIETNRFLLIKQGNSNYSEIESNTVTNQHSKLLFANPEHQIASIQWLLNDSAEIKSIERELLLISKNKDAEIRRKAIFLASQLDTPATLGLILESLEDENRENRIFAINALENLENEMSVRWLLHKFSDGDLKVQCTAADTFAFFFREEEAVVNHKYMAIPYLIKMLNHSEASIRACAARALGDAEFYRGAKPLIKLIEDKDIEVRSQAIRSLGLIREKHATPYLLKVLDDPNQPASVKFHGIVALQRLQYPDVVTLIQNTLDTATSKKDVTQIYNLIRALLILVSDRDDGIAVSSISIGKLVHNWLKTTNFTPKNKHEILHNALIDAIDILTKTNYHQAVSTIKNLSLSTNEDIRARAYSFLIRVDTHRNVKHTKAGITDESLKVRKAVYKTLIDYNISIRLETLVTSQGDKDITLLRILLLDKYHGNKATQFLTNTAINPSADIDVRILAFKILVNGGRENLLKLHDKVFGDPNTQIRKYALKYWSVRNKATPFIKIFPNQLRSALSDKYPSVRHAAIDAISLRHENWASQSLGEILFDNNFSLDTRKHIVKILSKHSDQVDSSILIRLSKLKHDSLGIDALNALSTTSTPEVIKHLHAILSDPKETEPYRFAAAQSLKKIDPKTDITNHIISDN